MCKCQPARFSHLTPRTPPHTAVYGVGVHAGRPIVRCHDWNYLINVRPRPTWPVKPGNVDARDDFRYDIPAFASAHAIAAAVGIVLAATLALWAHYGTAAFYEMIVAGIAACL